MSSVSLPNDQWLKVLEFLRSCPDLHVGVESRCRKFMEAVLWVTRSGAQWRLLPQAYGRWNRVYKRFTRWCAKGIVERVHQHFTEDPDMENFMIDRTVVRAHPCAAGALKRSGGQQAQALGRSRVGFSTKIHIAQGCAGKPLEVHSHGQASQ